MSLDALPTLLVVPPLNCLVAACVGAVLHRRRVGRVLMAVGLSSLTILAVPFVSGWLLASLEGGLPLRLDDADPPQAVVILSGDVVETQPPGAGYGVGHLTLERERAGARLARATGLPILVAGGRIRPGAPSIASLMAASLHVTHAWHMRRALIAFRTAGLRAVAAPVDAEQPPPFALRMLVPRVSAWQQSYYALHEWIGCVWYSLRG